MPQTAPASPPLLFRLVRAALRPFVLAFYRLRVRGLEHLPAAGGALLVSNHVSWLDGLLVLVASPRRVRMLADARHVESWWIRPLARLAGVIPIHHGPKALAEALHMAGAAIEQGELVCIFPEGGITRTGQLMPFKRGLMAIEEETSAPIIPVYLDELWGSIFSFAGGKFFWKLPRRWRYPVSIYFGRPLDRIGGLGAVRQAVAELGAQALEQRETRPMILPRAMLRACRRSLRRPKLADTMNQELTGGEVLLRSLILRRLLNREVLAPDEKYVGILLPPSVGGALANAALPLAGRIAVNLNYTMSHEVMNSCIRQCGIRHVLTSRRVVEKMKPELDAELVLLEDFREKVTLADKLVTAIQAYATPVALLERWLGLTRIDHDDLLTVIFTSGSTGEPKGVMLSHRNVQSNVWAIDQLVRLNDHDVVAGVLPFFHSFGYTTTLWTVLTLAPKGVYHFDPRDARHVGEMCRKHQATILISTPTFLRFYLKRCQPEEFAHMDVAVAGAEKLSSELCDAFEAKFGFRPVEGYGATELSPLVAVNIPDSRAVATTQILRKEGTVGRPIPEVTAKIVDLDSGQTLPPNQPGMLWIKGPNVMRGYLGRPEQTASVIKDGWYMTGDIAMLDDDGFIRITGRESRFSKIGGEMVPHVKIEEHIQKIIGAGEDELKVAVTAIPDERKGERIIVLHTSLEKTPDAICKELAQDGLPNLWIPSPDSFSQVDEIPVLGTGKVDLRGIKTVALEKFAHS